MNLDQAVEMNTVNQGVGEDPSYWICIAQLHFFGGRVLYISSSLTVNNKEFTEPHYLVWRRVCGSSPETTSTYPLSRSFLQEKGGNFRDLSLKYIPI